MVEIWNESGELPTSEELAVILGSTPASVARLASKARNEGLLPPESRRHKHYGGRKKQKSQAEKDLDLLRRVQKELGIGA